MVKSLRTTLNMRGEGKLDLNENQWVLVETKLNFATDYFGRCVQGADL